MLRLYMYGIYQQQKKYLPFLITENVIEKLFSRKGRGMYIYIYTHI
jgi:hypothetical protein